MESSRRILYLLIIESTNWTLWQICKDKEEAEVWFVALKALTSRVDCQKWTSDIRYDIAYSDGSTSATQRRSHSALSSSSGSSSTPYEVLTMMNLSLSWLIYDLDSLFLLMTGPKEKSIGFSSISESSKKEIRKSVLRLFTL